MSDSRPLFAFAFHCGLGQPLRDLAETAVAVGDGDFVWVHLDLRDAAAQAWLHRRPWPSDVVETVAAPIQRGRLFIKPDLVYDHLRDFRDQLTAGCYRHRIDLVPMTTDRQYADALASYLAMRRRLK